ncbi:MAG TPA: GNAT family N-acetyltransferase [Pseudonocardia sp.]|nr:GNAT family N-acetyltransferase [Pseudonocardia sp.]
MADSHPPISVRVADERDLPVMARLRRQWAAERTGTPVDRSADGGAFERTFEAWWRTELPRRTFWLAEAGTDNTGYTAVGSLNVVEIGNMPRPGGRPGRWGYVGNAFVVASYADRGVAAALLNAAVEQARERRYQRLVLRPTPSSAPFYLRHGFEPAGDGMLMFVPHTSVATPGDQGPASRNEG